MQYISKSFQPEPVLMNKLKSPNKL